MKHLALIRSADGRIGLDMLATLAEQQTEIELVGCRRGDLLVVDTHFSTYVFEKEDGTSWTVRTSNPERRHIVPTAGLVVEIHGCTFGGTMIKQDCVFVGGHLEFGNRDIGIVTTSVVERIRIQQAIDGSAEEDEDAEA